MIAQLAPPRPVQPEVKLWIEFLDAIWVDVIKEGPRGPAFTEARANLSELNALAGMLGLPHDTIPALLDGAVQEWERRQAATKASKRRSAQRIAMRAIGDVADVASVASVDKIDLEFNRV